MYGIYMGFPESGTGEGRSGSYFLKFSTTVNEETVDAKRKFVKSEFGGETYKAFWIKQVAFEKGETKKVVVKYRSPFGIGFANTGGSGSIIRYIFSGGNWYRKVKKSTLKIYFHIPSYVYPDEHREIKYESGHYSYERKNWEAEEYFEIVFRKKESEEQNPVSQFLKIFSYASPILYLWIWMQT